MIFFIRNFKSSTVVSTTCLLQAAAARAALHCARLTAMHIDSRKILNFMLEIDRVFL